MALSVIAHFLCNLLFGAHVRRDVGERPTHEMETCLQIQHWFFIYRKAQWQYI
jgi:hypothetical protein